jgi:hypothetical protein
MSEKMVSPGYTAEPFSGPRKMESGFVAFRAIPYWQKRAMLSAK